MDESRIGQYSISVTTYPIMALDIVLGNFLNNSVKRLINFKIVLDTEKNFKNE